METELNELTVIPTGSPSLSLAVIRATPVANCPSAFLNSFTSIDLPPLKWSSLKYVFRMEDKIDGKEEAYG